MDSTVVFDISSDEEPLCEGDDGDDHDWLKGVLVAVSGMVDDSDEVIVLDEIHSKPKQRKSESAKSTEGDVPIINPGKVDSGDDDCIILDGDPDKVVAIDDDTAPDSDEVLVVGRKGEIACRDYPHPRSSCAKYPFGSTPHEKYCNMCHCYVCDSIAPCAYWFLGLSSMDHCHANPKEEIWKTQRLYFKTGKKYPLTSKSLSTSSPMAPQQFNPVPAQNITWFASNPVPLMNQLPRPMGIRPCPSPSGFVGVSSIRNQCRLRRSRIHFGGRGFQRPQLPMRVQNKVIRRDRSQTMIAAARSCAPFNRMPQNTGRIGNASVNHTFNCVSPNSSSHVPQYAEIASPAAASSSANIGGPTDGPLSTSNIAHLPQYAQITPPTATPTNDIGPTNGSLSFSASAHVPQCAQITAPTATPTNYIGPTNGSLSFSASAHVPQCAEIMAPAATPTNDEVPTEWHDGLSGMDVGICRQQQDLSHPYLSGSSSMAPPQDVNGPGYHQGKSDKNHCTSGHPAAPHQAPTGTVLGAMGSSGQNLQQSGKEETVDQPATKLLSQFEDWLMSEDILTFDFETFLSN